MTVRLCICTVGGMHGCAWPDELFLDRSHGGLVLLNTHGVVGGYPGREAPERRVRKIEHALILRPLEQRGRGLRAHWRAREYPRERRPGSFIGGRGWFA